MASPPDKTARTRGARTRAADGLLSSNATVALIGLLAALVTLGFIVWLKVELRQQTSIRVPLAQSASHLEASINRSIAALRGWAAHRSNAARSERTTTWQNEIAPEVQKLEAIAESLGDEELTARVTSLASDLRELQRLQWLVEDVVHAPGNVPARVLYDREVAPLGRSILDAVSPIVRVRPPSLSKDLLLDLSDYQLAIKSMESTLVGLLRDYTPALAWRLEVHAKTAEALRGKIATAAEPLKDSDLADSIQLATRELIPYLRKARQVRRAREKPDWNIAQHLQSTQLEPLLERVLKEASQLAGDQNRAMIASGEELGGWATLVVLLAVVIGALSASALYVSFRVQFRMRQVLAKARMLGQYALEAPLGAGGMGEVYRARHALLRRPTAVKLLRARNALHAGAQERFRREVQATSQLTHPNTIQIFDYGRTPDGLFYYAMELLDGVNLDVLIRLTGPMPPPRVVSILLQVCGSLREAHEKGLLHRDIKPSNIMLTERGGLYDVAKVLDFGLVTDIGGTTGENRLTGTPTYLAPELIEHPDQASARSDIYALGCVGYFLLSGTPVFDSENVEMVLRAHLLEPPERPSVRLGRPLPAEVEAVVMTCLSKDPRERPESVEQLMALLEACEMVWTQTAARSWWTDYGEAVRAEASSGASDFVVPVRVERTAGQSMSVDP